MPKPIAAERVASIMLSWHSLEVISCRNLQSLWAGYGHICEVTVRATTNAAASRMRRICRHDTQKSDDPADTFALILKLISPPPIAPGSKDEGHLRKMMSYEVEQYFYSTLAPRLDSDVPMAHCITTTQDMSGKPGAELLKGLTATIMTDLRPQYPVAGEKRSELNETQVYSTLDWLSTFHRSTWSLLPTDLPELLLPPLEEAARRQKGDRSGKAMWLNGGYTYLATRRKEYASLAHDRDSEWSSSLCKPTGPGGPSTAEMVANVLTPRNREVETYIHGDVKSENLFTTKTGNEVAFFDFQYIGLGLGVCDLAKLFTCSVPLDMLTDDGDAMPDELSMDKGEKSLLERYHSKLLTGTEKVYEWDTFVRQWETALVDWLRFQASWGFWGNTDWLEARVRSIMKDQSWRDWLKEQQGLIK
ncbi:Uu.00g122770.m01.CDS01 [Anthostomella pinea]|uniref:Uu.00g122770.m01.CDS01 n=1 Tax=Anthostomella pinea TaxID=933095 RepID=A0AAI8VH71_9PEZI|nr:Uu.00g122770.m01.CDS01 [Anthostomella pinea]